MERESMVLPGSGQGTGIGRLELIDTLRGITICSMIAFHGMWDLVFLRGLKAPWYSRMPGYCWQQSICISFILISGFCIPFSKKLLRRGIEVSLGGLLVSLVTSLMMPVSRIVFGILTFLGAAMLIMAAGEKKVFSRVKPAAGLTVCLILFVIFKNAAAGVIGRAGAPLYRFPRSLYRNDLTTALGFPKPNFYSADYFPLIPWFFLFLCGYYICRLCLERGWLKAPVFHKNIPFFAFLGRHSLLIYLLHQGVLYLVLVMLPQMLQ